MSPGAAAPDRPLSRFVEAARAAASAASGERLVGRLEAVEAGAEELGLRWAGLAGLHRRLAEGSDGSWWVDAAPALLVHRDDAARLRLLLATRGRTTSVRLVADLAPPGWRPLPSSPFLEGAAAGPPVPRLAPDRAWAAHRLLAARGLLLPPLTRPLDLAVAALDDDPDDATRASWEERAARWGVRRLWGRVGEVVDWVRGAARPERWAEPVGEGPAPGRGERLRAGLRLQDSPGRALRYAAVILAGRRGGESA